MVSGSDSALSGGGFVFTPGSHYFWLTPNYCTVLPQALYTLTATLQSDGNRPLSVASVRASARVGMATVSSTTRVEQIPVGSTCAVTVTYDPTFPFADRSRIGHVGDLAFIGMIQNLGRNRPGGITFRDDSATIVHALARSAIESSAQ